jgi:hypothetical protein
MSQADDKRAGYSNWQNTGKSGSRMSPSIIGRRLSTWNSHDDQQNLIASNAVSIAESMFNPYAGPKAIYAGKKLVGFVMYESLHEDDKPHEYSI